MPPDAEIVVVGAGIAGAATARAIAGRGGDCSSWSSSSSVTRGARATEARASSGSTIRTSTPSRSNTADRGFVLERHGRVVVGSACSGHGFKFAPVVGSRLAELALDAAA